MNIKLTNFTRVECEYNIVRSYEQTDSYELVSATNYGQKNYGLVPRTSYLVPNMASYLSTRASYLILFFLILATNLAFSQLSVVSIEKVNLPQSVQSHNPKFSPDGKSIFFSNGSFNGIWKYDIDNKTTQKVVTDPHSGFGFDISPAGDKISYRRSIYQGVERTQEIVEKNLINNSTNIIESGRHISTPVYFNERVISASSISSVSTPSVQAITDEVKVLGCDDDLKIVILKNGKQATLDPLGTGGRYIWPQISPDSKTIVAVNIEQGAFLCTTDGSLIRMLGHRNAPAFTRDGKWIIYMVDIDDGHTLLDSDLYAVSVDGQTTIRLTNDTNINIFPAPSMTENKIAFSTEYGELFILTYEETR